MPKMPELFNPSEIKLALKRNGLDYKFLVKDSENCPQEHLIFLDLINGNKIGGKIIRSFTEGEVYHWPSLKHENIAPLLNVLSIRDDFNVFLTIDFKVNLKSIVHDEDFVYDLKCFDRKRTYARGIFSGLSYLHGRSLCLMNLSDDNIFICKSHDKAVISNFSFLACSQKITRDKLKVTDLYKGPESEKGEFDAIAAEIWASGTLMLDTFLAHMVPWAVVDYKPRRIMEVVDKLSLELLQAANVGSVITTFHLTKFKVFLKCFFKENPVNRITARYASIASFLSPKSENFESQTKHFEKIVSPDCNCTIPQTKNCTSDDHSFLMSICSKQSGNEISNNKTAMYFKTNGKSDGCLNLNEESREWFVDPGAPTWRNPNNREIFENRVKGNERHSFADMLANTLQSYQRQEKGVNIKTIKSEMKCDGKSPGNSNENCSQDQLNTNTFYNLSKQPQSVKTQEKAFRAVKSSKSCHIVKDETSSSAHACYQSKSLSFIKPRPITGNGLSSELCDIETCSHSSIESSPLEMIDKEESNFYLNRLFEVNKLKEEVTKDKHVIHKNTNINNLNDNQAFEDQMIVIHEKILPQNASPNFEEEAELLSREAESSLSISSDIQSIIEKVFSLKECQASLQSQFSLFSNTEFAKRQQTLLEEYNFLLHQEIFQLYEILSSRHMLSMDEIIKIINLSSNYSNENLKTTLENESRCFSQPPIATNKGNLDNDKVVKRDTAVKHEPKDDLYLQSRRRHSYKIAIETSEKQINSELEHVCKKKKEPRKSVIVGENKFDEGLIQTDTKHKRKARNVKKDKNLENTDLEKWQTINLKEEETIMSTKRNANKNLSKDVEKRRKKKKRESKVPRNSQKSEISRKPFFFCLCPGGKVEKSESICDLCQLNRLDYEFM